MATAELQIDNDVFRVTKWTIEPQHTISMHLHAYAYVVVPLSSGTMHAVSAGRSATAIELTAGQSYARDAGVEHALENRGTSTIRFVEIEKLR